MEHATRFHDIENLCRRFSVASLHSFGSRGTEAARWAAGNIDSMEAGGSDLDVGARPIPGTHWGVREKVLLTMALEDLFDVNRVDLVCLPEADPFLAANIIRGERLYARDDLEADEYDLYILRRAGDCAPLERERIALVLGEEA